MTLVDWFFLFMARRRIMLDDILGFVGKVIFYCTIGAVIWLAVKIYKVVTAQKELPKKEIE